MRTSYRRCAVATMACGLVLAAFAAGSADDDGSPIFGVRLPAGYRDWPVISVAHEKGSLNDIRAVLGNDIAIKAYREGTRPFPDGAIIARLAWKYVPSPENDAIFGDMQSYVAGAPTNVQLSVKDAKRYAATDGWGWGQFEDGKVNGSKTLMETCYPCHKRAPASDDLVFTHYAK